MRPVRLAVHGYTAFPDETEVDFAGVDLFAFTGPTGSGKSSLVDAMVFALYGSVPRLDRRAVAPVISVRRTDARVSFTFSIGAEMYTAVRVVRRTKTGASTKEARLERADGEVLAGNERELTEAVEGLLGLRFEQFTKCVVLPQNEFMRLLHEEPSKRQDLLVSLLGLGLYDRMARLARERGRQATQQAEVERTLLGKLAFATPEALHATERRIAALEDLRAGVDATKPQLERLTARIDEAAAEAAAARDQVAVLGTVTVPEGLGGRSAALSEARAAARRADDELERRVAEADAADTALASLPDRSLLEAAQRAHASIAELLAQQRKGRQRLAERSTEAERAMDALAVAEADAAGAAKRLDHALWEHRAADLAEALVTGEPCPVCRQTVVTVPPPTAATAVETARRQKKAADAGVAAARRHAEETSRAEVEIRSKLDVTAERLEAAAPVLAEHPDAVAVDRSLAEARSAEAAERAARSAASTAQRAAISARKVLHDLEAADVSDRRRFDEVRDRVAALGPPAASRTDLVADWDALCTWAAGERSARRAVAVAADERAASLIAERDACTREVTARCRAAQVEVIGGDLRASVGDALAAANSARARIDEAMTDAERHQKQLADHVGRAAIAMELHRLLRADNFEKWMLDEALAALVVGASGVLLDLSDGAYSLGLDDRSNFSVVDHRNADEVRSARTLSGGETFLASLALALALADQIGSLAADGAPQLESIFLDEGFGSLDPDTLDTVAAAIEELSARGRMVGLVSHVGELAERVPVRFEVRRGIDGSTVEKVFT